jgi:hypothetical protein
MYIVYIFLDIKHIRSTTVVYEQLGKVCRGFDICDLILTDFVIITKPSFSFHMS